MHIEPGVVSGAKLALSLATGAASIGLAGAMAARQMKLVGPLQLMARSGFAAALVLVFFQALPHARVGVSEVHLILGATLFLLFGAGPAACGLAAGLFLQGAMFEPQDLPQYGMNVTTLVAPILAVKLVAERIVKPDTPYVELTSAQTLKLSFAYQAGVVAWVAFWVLYGQGATLGTLASLAAFSAAYAPIVCLEALVDVAVLAAAKSTGGRRGGVLHKRLWSGVS